MCVTAPQPLCSSSSHITDEAGATPETIKRGVVLDHLRAPCVGYVCGGLGGGGGGSVWQTGMNQCMAHPLTKLGFALGFLLYLYYNFLISVGKVSGVFDPDAQGAS